MIMLYIAGKVSANSSFGTRHWRDDFCKRLAKLSGLELDHLDPLKTESVSHTPYEIFAKDCKLIKKVDCMVVYLSDDISVGGSQEILIAKYFSKPVIAFAPYGGKFNGSTRVVDGHKIEDYKDPFVFSTCDKVCGTIEEVAETIKDLPNIKKTNLTDIIENSLKS